VAVEDGRVVGTVTLYLDDGSEQWRPGDAMFRFLAVDPAARAGGSAGPCSRPAWPGPGPPARRRMALHTTEWMTTARAMYERAGFSREPEGDAHSRACTSSPTPPTCSGRRRAQPRRQQPGSWGGGTRPTLWRNASTTWGPANWKVRR
jgi:hypothetical protein